MMRPPHTITAITIMLMISACNGDTPCESYLKQDRQISKHLLDYKLIAANIGAKRTHVTTAFALKHPKDTSEIYGSVAVWKGYLKADPSVGKALERLNKPGSSIVYFPASSEITFLLHQYECSDSLIHHLVTNRDKSFPGKVLAVPLGNGWTYYISKELKVGGY